MKVLVSSCLLGEDVRYDGNNSSIAMGASFTFSQKEIFMDILCDNEIYSFCPEVSAGLGTPRLPAEIVSANKPFKVETNNEEDVTIPFLIGAKNALDTCKNDDIKVALLKSKSPSCGNLKIYDGTFSNTLVDGQGLTAKLLEENDVKVFNETQLEELKKFIETN
ncbi:DUF523 domain-containing protein [Poseidonibacter ostreae]|jgi:uncharacterized protein YbbK (DUF523 family)|uniref:DUF523 domain-containing protein n=1 Tax=Poseidonibacter ostreae TaxID=2654171 RepID=A0A6L4WV32_9BACT|nr:DUF523 domain-containing protein [Poseidonibacter ostreae]KAB7887266.1 DUF523 domain-containing protein [Poseidonibacter ostreae]KAB7890497.1 DUF523 domain-containing protein [Poseidonibacter ostreae]KAB7890910.1 DUF523 domain-containing protein [Poseidonibacter ostreae]MAC83126.1 hypothetical protein [Arcobacter sp.]|tara:strand:- start:12905 stop:13396 length:492 start_codon:yes stop_codon:yes gene_type:complete